MLTAFFLYVWSNYTYVTWLGLEMKNYSASEKILGLGLKRNSSHVFVTLVAMMTALCFFNKETDASYTMYDSCWNTLLTNSCSVMQETFIFHNYFMNCSEHNFYLQAKCSLFPVCMAFFSSFIRSRRENGEILQTGWRLLFIMSNRVNRVNLCKILV